MISDIGSLGNEQNEEDKLENDKRETDVKVVVPSEIRSDWPSNDGNTVRNSGKHKVDNGNTDTSLMDKEKISEGRKNDGFVRRGRETSQNTRCQQLVIIPGSAADNATNDAHEGREHKDGSFAEFGGESGDEGTSRTDNEEVVSGYLSDGGDTGVEIHGDSDQTSCEKRALLGVSSFTNQSGIPGWRH